MMQRTANANPAGLRRICKRSDQPKIERLENNDARLILRRKPDLTLTSKHNDAGTANENPVGLRRICNRSGQPKIERLENNDTRLMLRRKVYCNQGKMRGLVEI